MAAHQAPPSLGFSRQEHWSGLPFPSPTHQSEKWKWSCLVMSNSSWPHGLQPTRLLRPWDFPGKSTRVGCHCLLCETHSSGLIILYYSLLMFKGSWSKTIHKSVASLFLDSYYICIQQKSLNTYNTFIVSYQKEKALHSSLEWIILTGNFIFALLFPSVKYPILSYMKPQI